jgi:hypothetical protein
MTAQRNLEFSRAYESESHFRRGHHSFLSFLFPFLHSFQFLSFLTFILFPLFLFPFFLYFIPCSLFCFFHSFQHIFCICFKKIEMGLCDLRVVCVINGADQLLAYADGVHLPGDYTDTIGIIKKDTETLTDASKEVGLKINVEKTKNMLLSRHQNVAAHKNSKQMV